ncbi:MAG: alpha/beta hydrolase [Acholeplasmataceae bacterium]|nr:alpha/beta hydrolase [Acholeplasmataceae bacterium]
MKKKTIKIGNGETYAYLEQGSGNQVLLLIHGNFSGSLYYKPLFDRLPRTIRVIAPDLRGYGDSSYENRFDTLATLATDLRLFLKALNIDKVDVVGWSLGGGVAMELAARHSVVNKLILINSTTHKGYPIFKKNADLTPQIGVPYKSKEEMAEDPVQVKPVLDVLKTGNAALMSYIFEKTIYTYGKPQEEDNAVYIKETLKQRCLIDADWALANLNMGKEPSIYRKGEDLMKLIKQPVLSFWGTLDITVPEYMVLENNAALKDVKYVRFEKCGHSPLIDKPNELTKEILDFIS